MPTNGDSTLKVGDLVNGKVIDSICEFKRTLTIEFKLNRRDEVIEKITFDKQSGDELSRTTLAAFDDRIRTNIRIADEIEAASRAESLDEQIKRLISIDDPFGHARAIAINLVGAERVDQYIRAQADSPRALVIVDESTEFTKEHFDYFSGGLRGGGKTNMMREVTRKAINAGEVPLEVSREIARRMLRRKSEHPLDVDTSEPQRIARVEGESPYSKLTDLDEREREHYLKTEADPVSDIKALAGQIEIEGEIDPFAADEIVRLCDTPCPIEQHVEMKIDTSRGLASASLVLNVPLNAMDFTSGFLISMNREGVRIHPANSLAIDVEVDHDDLVVFLALALGKSLGEICDGDAHANTLSMNYGLLPDSPILKRGTVARGDYAGLLFLIANIRGQRFYLQLAAMRDLDFDRPFDLTVQPDGVRLVVVREGRSSPVACDHYARDLFLARVLDKTVEEVLPTDYVSLSFGQVQGDRPRAVAFTTSNVETSLEPSFEIAKLNPNLDADYVERLRRAGWETRPGVEIVRDELMKRRVTPNFGRRSSDWKEGRRPGNFYHPALDEIIGKENADRLARDIVRGSKERRRFKSLMQGDWADQNLSRAVQYRVESLLDAWLDYLNLMPGRAGSARGVIFVRSDDDFHFVKARMIENNIGMWRERYAGADMNSGATLRVRRVESVKAVNRLAGHEYSWMGFHMPDEWAVEIVAKLSANLRSQDGIDLATYPRDFFGVRHYCRHGRRNGSCRDCRCGDPAFTRDEFREKFGREPQGN